VQPVAQPPPGQPAALNHADLIRELDKVLEALTGAGDHLTLMNESNAALHKSERVLYSPLTTCVLAGVESAQRVREALNADALRTEATSG